MIPNELVELSRLQFAVTALYHYLFVPLTLGLSMLLVAMELCYVRTGKQVYKDMVRFWGKLFGINFAMGVMTGITMEFQFGTNWAYYSHYVGDIFGAPLAIEGLMAFFLESTFVGLFFFGWDRLKKGTHLLVTFLMALGSNLSALWILVANAWMMYPAGSSFNPVTMRMEMDSFFDVVLSPWAQAKFTHTIFAGYCAGAMFVLAISAWYLMKKRDTEFARKSFGIAAAFGTCVALLCAAFGDQSGYLVARDEPAKIASVEAIWNTEEAPAPMALVALIDEKNCRNSFEITVPWIGGMMATRSITKKVPGLNDIIKSNRERIVSGLKAVSALETLRADPKNGEAKKKLAEHSKDLGFGLLTKQFEKDTAKVTPAIIDKAARASVPANTTSLFWTFRIMAGIGMALLAVFGLSLFASVRKAAERCRHVQLMAMLALPLPWIACEVGWFVAEYGRQPWTIFEILPTHLSVSSLSAASLFGSLAAFVAMYSVMLVIELWLMVRFAKMGPSCLGTGRYFHETH